jgi:outer membrane protein
MKKLLLLLIISLTGVGAVTAEEITKVAVLDYSRILSAFYKDSRAVRELEELKAQFQEESEKIQDEIKMLEARKLDAENDGNNSRALELDNEIFKKKNYLRDYIRVKNAQLTEMNKNLSQNMTLVSEINEEIQYVAESKGFSLVFKKSDPSLLWWNYEVDITDQVIDRLVNQH